ncbi:hypothetical protein [Dryocola sp. BD613]|uniref:hypothetical protein n=1 Tax=Dryocola sp. BD613 TaxID=3133272 RepID=UPI003F5089E2
MNKNDLLHEKKIDFYQEVEILPSCNPKNKKFIGKKGGVMGVSEENGVLYGYSIKLYEEEYLLSFDKDEIVATGKQLKQDDFY